MWLKTSHHLHKKSWCESPFMAKTRFSTVKSWHLLLAGGFQINTSEYSEFTISTSNCWQPCQNVTLVSILLRNLLANHNYLVKSGLKASPVFQTGRQPLLRGAQWKALSVKTHTLLLDGVLQQLLNTTWVNSSSKTKTACGEHCWMKLLLHNSNCSLPLNDEKCKHVFSCKSKIFVA